MLGVCVCWKLLSERGHHSLGKCFSMFILVTFWFLVYPFNKCIVAADEININDDNSSLSDIPILVNKESKEDETRSHAAWVFLPDNKLRTSSSTQKKAAQAVPKRREEAMPNLWHSDNGRNNDDDSSDGTTKTPGCAQYGRYYCTYKEDYPSEVVNQVIKYMKTPLEKLFRDLRNQKKPRIADNADGSLVCDSITRIVRPGWAKNNNAKWVVVINTEAYQQHVTEVVCRYDNSYCNFVPPCYQASCQQRYNIQMLLVIDPYNPYKGPFLSKFLFPSCCVCYVPKLGQEKNQDDY